MDEIAGYRSLIAPLGISELHKIQPHVISLSEGMLSSAGIFKNNEKDVERIFSEHLLRALKEASNQGKPLQILFFAHGGLVAESLGLEIAFKHIQWWKDNGIYPIYFVWETGLLHTIGVLLREAARGLSASRGDLGSRDLWDHTTDPFIEMIGKALGTKKIWGAMKRSAERASAQGGGALAALQWLKQHVATNGADIRLHAVGHSAGAIFHCHFLSEARKLGLQFDTLQFLAPAITIDLFREKMLPVLNGSKTDLTVFCMNDLLERADDCAGLYNKSILYFVSRACEDENDKPILGLEASIKADREVASYIGAHDTDRLILSNTKDNGGRSASRSTSHVGFDDDPPTMESVLRRVLKVNDSDPIRPYIDTGARGVSDFASIDWPEPTLFFIRQMATDSPRASILEDLQSGNNVTVASGRKLALYVGVNKYAGRPLRFCVSDSERWRQTLEDRSFATFAHLLDERATKQAILTTLRAMISAARPGDVLVFQYAGHGTVSPYAGFNASSRDDNAIVPFDGEAGMLIFDYELRSEFARLPNDVNMTCFMDCCHAGTNTRAYEIAQASSMWARGIDQGSMTSLLRASKVMDERTPRFLDTNEQMRAAFEAHLAKRPSSRNFDISSPPPDMRNLSFAACLDSELAYEYGGNGRFTLHATNVIRELKGQKLTNEEFLERLRKNFTSAPQVQHPEIDALPKFRSQPFLAPITNR